jgi:4-hydroxy 2-oxovalerate aldolase
MYDYYDLFIFDLDDTIIKSEKHHYFCWLKVLQKNLGNDFTITYEYFCSIFHSINTKSIENYIANNLKLNYIELKKQKDNYYFSHINDLKEIEIIDGFEEMIDNIINNKKKFVIVTNNSKKILDFYLQIIPVLKKSSKNYYNEKFANKKPNPECYLNLANDFHNCKMIAFEDSITGIHALQSCNIINKKNPIDIVFINDSNYYYYDFIIKKYNIINIINNYKNIMINKYEILDCTIRDGGYVNNWNFSDEQIINCYEACNNSNIDYMEIGFRNKKTDCKSIYGETFFCNEEYINKLIPIEGTCKLAVMVTINEFDIFDFLPKEKSKISLVRVLMAYHGSKKTDDNIDMKLLEDGLIQVNQLINLGYIVSFNIGRIDKLSFDQIQIICEELNKTKIKYFTMADTYGSVDLNHIEKLIPFVKSILRDDIKIGFHAHDNFSNATSKSLYSLKFGATIIDGCILGFGRGSGNAKTELLLMDLNKNHRYNYDFINAIEYGDNFLINYKNCTNNSSYNVVYALSAYFGCHITYAIQIIEKYDKIGIKQIYYIFKKLKEMDKNMFYYDDVLFELYKKNIMEI